MTPTQINNTLLVGDSNDSNGFDIWDEYNYPPRELPEGMEWYFKVHWKVRYK